jgi:hypothetical protein
MDFSQIMALVSGSDQYSSDDYEILKRGMEMLNRQVISQEEAEEDLDKAFSDGKITEIIFTSDLIDNKSDDPKYISLISEPEFLVLKVGSDQAIECSTEIDRYVGFQAVEVGNMLAKVKENMIEDHVEFRLLTTDIVEEYIGPYNTLDVFQPPRLITSVDDDVIATQKKVYRSYLNKLITDEDRVIYINGDFGAVAMRKYQYKVDCLFFSDAAREKSTQDRLINNTEGEDFFFEFEDKEKWVSLLSTYTVIMHNFLFGDVYKVLQTLDKSRISLIAMGTIADTNDKDIYLPSSEKYGFIEEYPINYQLAEKFKFQILHDDPDYYVVQMDHGRYIDYKPYNYQIMVPFHELDNWVVNRYYQIYNHFGIFISGPKHVFYSDRYPIPDGPINVVQVVNNRAIISGEELIFQGLEGYVLASIGNQIYDINVPGPYWLRRMYLANAGIVFDRIIPGSRVVVNACKFREYITSEEKCFHDYVQATKIKPYIEVKGVGLNPLLSKMVFDYRANSHIFYMAGQNSVPDNCYGITFLEDGSFIFDDFGDFYMTTSCSYSRNVFSILGDEILGPKQEEVIQDYDLDHLPDDSLFF